MKKLFLTLLTCIVAMLANAQTLSTTAVSTFNDLEDGAIYALKTFNSKNKDNGGGWYYRNNAFKFTLNPNDITPGQKVEATNNKFLWKVYKRDTDKSICLVNMYDGVYFAQPAGTTQTIHANTTCNQAPAYYTFEASNQEGRSNYTELSMTVNNTKYYIAANDGQNLGYWNWTNSAQEMASVQFYKIEDPANIELPVRPNKPYFFRLGDGSGQWSAGGYINSIDGSSVKVNGQNPNLSTLGSEWIFEGDYAKGFKIINVKSKKVLGINTVTLTNAASSEGNTPIQMYENTENSGENISILWDVTGNTFVENGFTINVKGSIRDRANYRDGKLAFWNNGMGSGSALRIYDNVELPLTQVGEKYYATTYLPFAVTIPEGVNAYTATLNENNVTLNAVTGVLPAETAVILEGNAATASFALTSENSTVDKGNMLGTLEAKTIDAGTTNYLILGRKGDALGFYLPKETMTSIAGNRAYFNISANNAAQKGFSLNFDVVSGINNAVAGNNNQGVIYDLTGRCVNNTVKGGIYICNGKKIIIK